MSWYKEYKEEWTEIIETVAAEEHRQTQMIEKDTIQSMILFKLSKSELPFVFKGGTSLSKAYGLIDRFSEDIDLSMNRKPTESEKKNTKKLICSSSEELGLVLSNADDIQSRHSYNKYSDYNNITKKLLYEDVSYEEAISKGIAQIADMDIFKYNK